MHNCTIVQLRICTYAHISILNYSMKGGVLMNRGVGEKPMKEILYRESRVARALGEPSKYAIIDLLLKHGPLNVNEIVKKVRRSQSTVSHHLSKLRSLEIVRYEAKADGVYYWIKYPQELRTILRSLKIFIRRTQKGLEHET